jgi:hypothetical protein
LAFTAVFGDGSAPIACWNDAGTGGCAQIARGAVCGANGAFLNVQVGQIPTADAASPYFGATPAVYVEGFGLTCSLTDIATYGGDPWAYVDSGYNVDQTGKPAPAEMSDGDFGALYRFYARKS